MNRGGNEPPAESASGGMYSKVARDRCEDQLGTVYSCGTEAPDTNKARRDVRVNRRRGEKKKIRFKEDKKLVEDQPRKKQTWPEVQHESAVEDLGAPVWWQLGVE